MLFHVLLSYDKSSLWAMAGQTGKMSSIEYCCRYMCESDWGTPYALFSGEGNISMLFGSCCCLSLNLRSGTCIILLSKL
jgi:hypothetical protein